MRADPGGCAANLASVFQLAAEQSADLLLTIKNNQRRQHQMIVAQFRGHRHLPVEISHFAAADGRHVRGRLRARNATDTIRERRVGASGIIELVSTGRRDGKPFQRLHFFLTTRRTRSKPWLQLVRQRGAIEKQWHGPRDTQLGEDAHRYAQRKGVQVLALLRTSALKQLRRNGFRSIHAESMAAAHDIGRMLVWVGVNPATSG